MARTFPPRRGPGGEAFDQLKVGRRTSRHHIELLTFTQLLQSRVIEGLVREWYRGANNRFVMAVSHSHTLGPGVCRRRLGRDFHFSQLWAGERVFGFESDADFEIAP